MTVAEYAYRFEWSRTGRPDDWHLDSFVRGSADEVRAEVARLNALRADEIAKRGHSDYAPHHRIVRRQIGWQVVEDVD